MAVRKTTLEKAVAVLRLLEGGEGSAASADPSRFREDSQSGKCVKVPEQWLLCRLYKKLVRTVLRKSSWYNYICIVPTWKCIPTIYNREIGLYYDGLTGQTAGSSAVNKLLTCKRKQEQLYQHGPQKKLKLSEPSDKSPDGLWVCINHNIAINIMFINDMQLCMNCCS